MTLQFAGALWWMVPLAGAIIALYLLKMRRRDLRVPAVFLWPTLTADVRANAPIQKLRVSLLLLLQLLVVALVIFGLANPLRRARGLNGRATAIVLDASASMGATDVVPSRFERARQKIAGIVAAMGTGDRLALIEAGPATRVVFPLASDKAKMNAALRTLRATDAPNDPGEALRLAAALVGQQPGGRIVVLSDGAFPPVADFSPGKAEIVFEPIGTGRRNLALVAFEAAERPGANGALQLFAGVRNYNDAPGKATLSFEVDGQTVDARSIIVPAGQTRGQTLDVPPTAHQATVRLSAPGDILQADNRAALFLQGAGTVRTLLVTSGNLFLERALALEPAVRLDRSPTVPVYEQANTPGEKRYDLVIFDNVAPVPVKAPAVWSLGGVSQTMPVVDMGAVQRPRVLATQKRSHPILRNAALDNLLIEKGRKVRAKPEGQILLDGSKGPLIVASERNGRRTLYLAWNLLDSDFPLQVAFPIFVGNAVSWLTGANSSSSGGLTVRAGQPFSVTAPETVTALTLTGPNRSETLDTSTGSAIIRSTDVVGDYTLVGGSVKTPIAVNLLSETESDVVPRAQLEFSQGSVPARTRASLVLAETWRPLVLLALVVLAFEWWWFVRRS